MITKHFWKPLPQVEHHIAQHCATMGYRRIADVGGSKAHRFASAHRSYGWAGDVQVDLDHGELPLDIDFVYCRHTLEDLANPAHLLGEIERIGCDGYIETPSPLAELTRGVDAGVAPHVGYMHHRWILWSDGATLFVISKYPLVELMRDLDRTYDLNQGPRLWNTHHQWTGPLQWRVLQHERDYNLHNTELRWHGMVAKEYEQWLLLAQSQTELNNAQLVKRLASPQMQEV